MFLIRLILAAFTIPLAITALGGEAHAGATLVPAVPQTIVEEDRDETRFFGGLRWSFGSGAPEIVAGVRHENTSTSDNVSGAQVDIAIPFSTDGITAPKARIMGLFGNRSVQGLAGVGYDFDKAAPLLGLGVQGPFSEGGANIYADGTIDPYLGKKTLDREKGPKRRLQNAPIILDIGPREPIIITPGVTD